MAVYYPKAVAILDIFLYDYGDSSKQTEFTITVSPVDASVNINSYNQADTFNLVVRYEDLPFDPRLIRAIRTTILITDVGSLRDFTTEDVQTKQDDIMFIGYADSYNMTMDGTERMVNFEGRDYTSFFIDTNFDDANLEDDSGKRKRKIDLNRPVIDIIKDLISNTPGAESIPIVDQTNGQAIKNFAKSIPNFTLVSGRKISDGQFTYSNQNQTYWDVIVSLCEASAIICYIQKDVLILTTPRILYTKEAGSKKVLQFIYGNNLSSLQFTRNLGRKKKFNILLRSFNLRNGKATVVSIPNDSMVSWANSMNVEKGIQKVQYLDSTGVQKTKNAPANTFIFKNKTREELVDIGQKIFEEYVRQQLEGDCETREMSVNDTEGVEFDVTKIQVGTPILLDIMAKDLSAILRFNVSGDKISDAQRIKYLVNRGYNQQTASALIDAVATGTGKLRPLFYVREAQFSMGSSGFSLRIGFVNYIQISERIAGKIRST